MAEKLAMVTIVVDDYDTAINFYTQKLGFQLLEDTRLSDVKRWVRVAPAHDSIMCLLLAKAANESQALSIGNQTGGRVFLFLYTDTFDTFFNQLLISQVTIIRQPVIESWGRVAVFSDLYGNLWDLIEQPDKG